MTKIDIFSGFLGSGKTTLIKKLVAESFKGEKVVLIENEFGEINIDSGFLKDSGIEITEMSSGCICCTLVGDFGDSLRRVITQFEPDRVLIEPSGVGKLSDVIRAVQGVSADMDVELSSFVTVADAKKCRLYVKNFGEFYLDQIEHAKTIILSRTQELSEDKLQTAVKLLREHNADAKIITTPWDELTGAQILEAMEGNKSLADKLLEELAKEPLHEHHHHDHDHDEHEHHHHDHDHEHEHHHHHDHDHDHDHSCCEHDHDHHHHDHDADDVFSSWGIETPKKFSREEILDALEELDLGTYGTILRAKGIVESPEGTWLHFDYVPGESEIREGTAGYTGQLCVIGAELKNDKLTELFAVK
jgi:G3E family GTPase